MARPLSIEMQRHFDGIANAYYDIVDRAWYDVGYYHRKESAFLRNNIPESVAVAVDAGCGPGRQTLTLCERARRVIAIDMSRGMLRGARDRAKDAGSSRVDFIQADIRRLPLKNGIADLVVNLEVLEHLPGKEPDVRAALNEFSRVLRGTGRLVLEAPLRRHYWWRHVYRGMASFKEVSPEEKTRYYVNAPLVVDHFFLERDLDSSLNEAGFDAIKKRYVRFFPSGMVERYPGIAMLEPVFERAPVLRHLCREALWLAIRSPSALEVSA